MDFTNPIFLISLLMGLVFIIAGWIMIKFPPKWPNHLYGYRTARAMKNEENWVLAQRFSAKEMMKMGMLYILLAVLAPFIPMDNYLVITVSFIIMVILLIYPIITTERALKRFENKKSI